MSLAPQIRKYILQALERSIIPALQKEVVVQVLAAPPFDFSQVEHWTVRSKYLPHKTPELTQMVWAWKSEHLVTSRMAYIGFVFEGVADEKIGITTKMAKSMSAKTAKPHGITALRLPAPSVIAFPSGTPRRDGSLPFCETSRPGFAPSRIFWVHLTANELLVHYCESDENRIFSSNALLIKDGFLTHLAYTYIDELHYAHHEGNETSQTLLLVLMKRLHRHLTIHAVPLSNTVWPSHNHISFKEAQSSGEYLCQKAVEYIVMHLQDSITWEMLAKHLECSPFYLNRVFQKFTGMSVMRYVTFRRIDVAKHLLAQENQRIGEITRLTGFANIDSFSTCFKRLTGHSPSEFRRNIQNARGE